MELSLRHPLSDRAALKAEGRIPVYMPGGSRVVVGYATIANDGTINIQMHDTDDVSDLVDKLSLGAIKGVSFDYLAATAEMVVPKQYYVVEHDFLYGWDDAGWQIDGKPWRFNSREEALDEIRALCADTGYNPEDYRVVEAKE